MTNYNIKLSVEQIRKMRHAIGLTADTPANKMYTPYRNYYVTGKDPDWEELVEAVLQEVTGIKINTPK